MTITPEQIKWLRWLKEHGGSAFMDSYGRLVAMGETSLQGAQISWLNLICKGYITVQDEHFIITSKGNAFLNIEKTNARARVHQYY